MIELFSIKDVAKIFGLREARLRYWLQTGFIWPTVRRGGRFFYTFQDLIAVKTAVELLDSGIPMQRVRKSLDRLRRELPANVEPTSRLRVCSDGNQLVVVDDDVVYEPESGQLVMAFAVSSLTAQVGEVRSLADAAAVPRAVDHGPTQPHQQPTAYQCFLDGCAAEERRELALAEQCYRHAIDLEPSLAAAHTNLGNILYRRGLIDDARACYERAIELAPEQPEARFNLGCLFDELGETELAIAELRGVCSRSPDFADAHYNLGVILAKVGGVAQARQHFGHYLELDPSSEWAERARGFVQASAV